MSNLIMPTRRGFLMGLGALIAAPAVVHFENIMPVSVRALPSGLLIAEGHLIETGVVRVRRARGVLPLIDRYRWSDRAALHLEEAYSSGALSDDMPIEEWMAAREAQLAAKAGRA